MDLTFRQLEVLASVVRSGSFGAAADALGVSQVSVSRHVASLERATGMVLFRRVSGKPAEPTRQGEELHRFAEMVIAAYQNLQEKQGDKSRLPAMTIEVAASEATIDLSFMPRFAEFCQQHPRIEVRFTSITSSLSSLASLDPDKIDLAYLALTESPEYVSGRCLGTIACGLYASPELAERIRKGEGSVPIIWPPRGGPVSRMMVASLIAAGLTPYEIVQQVQRLSSGIGLARLGLGVCGLAKNSAEQAVKSGELVNLGPAGPLYSYAIPLRQPMSEAARIVETFFSDALIQDTIR